MTHRVAAPVLRVARPTDDIERLLVFYRDGLGFQILTRFNNHSGFDGVILGHPNAPWHLEFTKEKGNRAGGAPSPEHLLVLYLPKLDEWQQAVALMRLAGHVPVPSHNPYWDQSGQTFVDPDGYRIVLQHVDWTL